MTFALAELSAVLLVLVFPAAGLAWIAPAVLAPLVLAAARERRGWPRFLAGWLAGTVFWAAACFWIQFVLEVHGGMGPYLSWLAFALFALYKGLHLGAFTWALAASNALSRQPLFAAALWTGLEVTHGKFGFAWLMLGNAATGLPGVLRLAPWLGVYGISFLLALCGAAIGSAILVRNWRPLLWIAPAALVPLLPPLPESAPDRHAVLMQPNVAEERSWTVEQWRAESGQMLAASSLAAAPGVDLIAWPEVPAPLYYFEDPEFQDRANGLARQTQAYFLTGTVAHTPRSEPLNSAVLIDPSGRPVGRYDKVNLVPFGEFVPPLFSWVNKITKEAGDYTPGERQIALDAGGHKLGVFICYEAAFPDFVRRFAALGAGVFVNISNDGYFGASAAREQHLQLVRMRAAENARWILRPTNNGVSAAVDPAGRVVHRLPAFTPAAERVGFAYSRALTFFSRTGDWFAWLCLAGSAAALAGSAWRFRGR